MIQWHVELICKDEVLLTFLATCLHESGCTVIENNSERFYLLHQDGLQLYRSSDLPDFRDKNHYYWLSSDFDQKTDPYEVLSIARQQLPLLNGIIKLKYGTRVSSIGVDDVYQVDQEYRLIKETATMTLTGGRLITSVSMLQNINIQHLSISTIWELAYKYPEVEEALNYLSNQTNWFNLYKAYEVIMKETRRLEASNKIKMGTFDRWMNMRSLDFEQSAHKVRHSKAGYTSKKNVTITYISLNEAVELIANLFMQWLQTKPI